VFPEIGLYKQFLFAYIKQIEQISNVMSQVGYVISTPSYTGKFRVAY